jgi:hypothetical protein
MAKTIGVLLALTIFGNANADMAYCALDGARAVDDLIDSATYIMASITRCRDVNNASDAESDSIRCALDISSTIESVNKAVNVILKAVASCGGLQGESPKCGMAVGELTRSMAGLSAASAGIIANCPNSLNNNTPLDTWGSSLEKGSRYSSLTGINANNSFTNYGGFSNHFGQCLIDVKDTVKSLFKATARILTVTDNCADIHSPECNKNVAKIVAAFSDMGSYLAGAVGKCSNDTKTDVEAECAQYSLKLADALADVDRSAAGMQMGCGLVANPRLYSALEEDDDIAAPASGSGAMTFSLAALLPITAVVGFVGGKRLRKGQEHAELFVPEE